MANTLHTPAATAETHPTPAHFEALRLAHVDRLEDAGNALDTLKDLEALFAAIRRLAPDSELYGLAKIGEYLAQDRRNHLDCRREEAQAAMEEAAVVIATGAAMTDKTLQAATTSDAIEATKRLFGAHPEDVISPIKSAAETLDWLEEIFDSIAREIDGECSPYRLHKLAKMGAYLASDIANYADGQHEEMLGRLIEAGTAPAEAARRAARKGGAV